MKSHFEPKRDSFADVIDQMTDADLDAALAAGKANGLYQTFVEGKEVLAKQELPRQDKFLGLLA